MTTALLSNAVAATASTAVSSSRVFHDDSSSVSFGARHSGLRKVAYGVKKSQQQQQRRQGGAGFAVQATSIRPRRITADEVEFMPVSPDDQGVYTSGNQVIYSNTFM
jgi:hypothetical protein